MESLNSSDVFGSVFTNESPENRDRMLVVLDDDKVFLRTISRAALKYRMICVPCDTIESFFEATMYFSNAVILIDQNLGLSKKVLNRPQYYQKGDQLLRLLDSKKIYLMSADPKVLLIAMEYQNKVKGFISKEIGVANILKFIGDSPVRNAK
jgi:hypothetical protein